MNSYILSLLSKQLILDILRIIKELLHAEALSGHYCESMDKILIAIQTVEPHHGQCSDWMEKVSSVTWTATSPQSLSCLHR